MEHREQWLADTLVELADTLVTDFDLVELLTVLVERCVELLDAAEVGLVLEDQDGRLAVMASSTERMRAVELFEVQSAEGPCLDCLRTGAMVDVQPLDDDAERRWPAFAPMARDAGYRAVLALPMRLRDRTIGAVNVFLDDTLGPSTGDLRLAQALSDSATIGILQQRRLTDSAELSAQLQGALNTRIAIEQAKGMLSEQLQVDVADAFQLIRGFARHNNRTIAEVAHAVLDKSLQLGPRAPEERSMDTEPPEA